MSFPSASCSKRRSRGSLAAVLVSVFLSKLISPDMSAIQAAEPLPGNQLLADFFRLRTAELTDRCLADIKSADDWKAHREEYRRQLQEMLGLSPWPERTPLKPEITGRIEKEDFVVEKLHFESSPGLYVSGDLYRPRTVSAPLPAILYVCGHSVMKKGDVSLGNKTGYQKHGAWFARNGYVCLIIDTIQLGEIPGIHHGTYNLGKWWWHSRGYTPAGVEAWNGIRAIDYLQSRAEVDPERIGVTGRSGGGAYTWYIAALDERVKAAVPVAGITSLKNHVVDGCVEGHCDCMYQVNSYGWDYPLLAALVSPRPLLISNQDTDRIFPLDGVVDVFTKARRIYELQGAGKQIGLCIAAGGHEDIQELQIDAFHWMNRHLKGDRSLISMAAEDMFPPEELTVFQTLPADERVTQVQEWFIPARSVAQTSSNKESFQNGMQAARKFLVHAPGSLRPAASVNVSQPDAVENDPASGARLREYRFDAGRPYRLSLYVLDHGENSTAQPVILKILNQGEWVSVAGQLKKLFPKFAGVETAGSEPLPEFTGTLAFFAPRGVGPTFWAGSEKEQTHIRRRFTLLGTTLEREQVEDVRQAMHVLEQVTGSSSQSLHMIGTGVAAGWGAVAAFLEAPAVSGSGKLTLIDLPTAREMRPQLLRFDPKASFQDLLLEVCSRSPDTRVTCHSADDFQFFQDLNQAAARLQIPEVKIQSE